jgi:hypothetical protein
MLFNLQTRKPQTGLLRTAGHINTTEYEQEMAALAEALDAPENAAARAEDWQMLRELVLVRDWLQDDTEKITLQEFLAKYDGGVLALPKRDATQQAAGTKN